MRPAVRFAIAAVALAGAAPAAAYVRSTTAPGEPGAGVCLWWGPRQLTYQLNAQSTSRPPCASAAAAEVAVDSILGAWGRSCTDFRFIDGGTTWSTDVGNDGVNLIVFRRGSCSDTGIVPGNAPCRATGTCADLYNCWDHGTVGDGLDAVALTFTTFRVSTGEILDADVELFGWNGSVAVPEGAWFTCRAPGDPICSSPGEAGCISTDVATVVLHEGGHMLGLDHVCEYAAPYDPPGSCATDAVMGPGVVPGSTRTVLAADDEAGVCAIYPTGAATLKCVAEEPPKKSGGCASGAGGGLAVAFAGLTLLRALRRGRRAGLRS